MHIPCSRRLYTLALPVILAPLAVVGISISVLRAETDAPRFTLDPPTVVFINEIHYDNVGGDVNEQIEVAAPSGTDMSTARIVLYNGSGGGTYSPALSLGSAVDQCGDYDLYVLSYAGIQNGPSDAIALYNDGTSTLVQLLSYEGVVTASGGIADGVTSTDIGVAESDASTPITYSLQLTGNGGVYDDFTWQGPVTSTFGACNIDQTLTLPTTLIELADFQARPTATGIMLAWQTTVEVDNAGFHLYRGGRADEPVRITDQLIGAQAPPGHGASYSFRDTAGDAHAQYWLEDVATDGTTTRHGPFAVEGAVHAVPRYRAFLPAIIAGGQP